MTLSVDVGRQAAGGEGEAAGCNDKNKNPTIECGDYKLWWWRWLWAWSGMEKQVWWTKHSIVVCTCPKFDCIGSAYAS